MTFTRGFPVSEFEMRVQNAQRMMRKAELDALLFMTERGYDFAPGKMMLHEENVVVRADGAEFLTGRAFAEIPIL